MTLSQFPGYATAPRLRLTARTRPACTPRLAHSLPPLFRARGPDAQWSLPVLPAHHTCASSKKAGASYSFQYELTSLAGSSCVWCNSRLSCEAWEPGQPTSPATSPPAPSPTRPAPSPMHQLSLPQLCLPRAQLCLPQLHFPRAQLRLPCTQLRLPCASSVSPSFISHVLSSVSPSRLPG